MSSSLCLCGPLPGPGHNMPPQWGQITFLSGRGQSFSDGTTNWGFRLQLLNLEGVKEGPVRKGAEWMVPAVQLVSPLFLLSHHMLSEPHY